MSKYIKLWVTFSIMVSFILAGTDGTIRGKVTDAEGKPLPGANIYIPDAGIGAAADADGNYIILNIPVGDYEPWTLYGGNPIKKIYRRKNNNKIKKEAEKLLRLINK